MVTPEPPVPRLLKDRVREAIENSGHTKAAIARMCRVTNAAVTSWLSGETQSLMADKSLALERATGYRAPWLITGKGPRRLTDAEQLAWPFPLVDFERFARLRKDDQGYVQRRLLQAIQECERPDEGSTP